MQKSSNDGFQGPTFAGICLDLWMSFALVARANLSLCNALRTRTSQTELPKSETPRLSVVCGRPVSVSSSKGGARLKVVGK